MAQRRRTGPARPPVVGPVLTSSPDLAYLVRPGDDNEELRYSLRSVAKNMSHFGRVWIVGAVPSWVRGVEVLPLEPAAEKFANMRQSLTALCAHEDVAENVVLFNDDHYVISPLKADDLPVFHLGLTEDYVAHLLAKGSTSARNTWLNAMRDTSEWVKSQGVEQPICYETHTPLPFNKAKLAQVLADYPADRRFAYPEAYQVAGAGGEGVGAGNAKVGTLDSSDFLIKISQNMPYLSSNDRSFADGMIGGYIRGMFTRRCDFEAVSP